MKAFPAHFSPKTLDAIVRETGTPVYVYSEKALVEPLRRLQKGLKGLDHRICYAVKANSNLAVLELLLKEGAGLDIVSGGELFRARAAGARSSDIVFSGVGKTPEEMAEALLCGNEGIFCFNVESIEELRVLNNVATQVGRVAPVAFRFNPDVDAKTHPYISTGLRINKFGLNRREILQLARELPRFNSIRLRGISIHIGSQLLSLAPLDDAFTKAKQLFSELERLLGAPLTQIDLGGGLGIAYDGEKAPSIESYCRLIRRHFGRSKGLKILLEPGRVIAAQAGLLLTQVLYWKIRQDKRFLIVDAAMNDLIRPALYEGFHAIVPVKKTSGPQVLCDVVGPVCETGDFFARDRRLPSRLSGGDLVAVLSAGAYGFSMSSQYNSRPRAAEVLVGPGGFRVIRERETYADLIRGETAKTVAKPQF